MNRELASITLVTSLAALCAIVQGSDAKAGAASDKSKPPGRYLVFQSP